MTERNHEEPISKTQMKKRMDELQDLGMELTRLSTETLKKIGLPEDLYEAVREYKKITSNGATKRQTQYIGRLMRETDPAPIRAFLARLKGESSAHNAFLQRVEQVRLRLLESDEALTAFVAEHPHADTAALRTLIRNTRKERELNKLPKNFRALYQEIKTVMSEEADSENQDEA
ncbi:MAG: ribosome biogenesis factor YjgA [Neisseria sp.]|uniref:ribosome biogenesis factor YjgA n=1 Tax=Neisseria sp. TaxID=192066 RepID=UPI0026DC0A5E|nr:ribosome biogenesis factor YjgA [Neisseria sp.]MDO4640718.1 ribosome biogenesis factor YjgA [Neisseria sp.]